MGTSCYIKDTCPSHRLSFLERPQNSQVRKMKIILFLGIVAVLVQHISCQCQAFQNGGSCCFNPGSSCCFDSDQNCCIGDNGRCEGRRRQGGGSCQQGTRSKTCWKSDFDGTQTKTTYKLSLNSDCSGRLTDTVETTLANGQSFAVGGHATCNGNCRLPDCN